MNTLTATDPILERIDILIQNAKRGKDKHFKAADRKNQYNIRIGLPLILINAFLASKLTDTYPFIQWMFPILATSAVFLSSIQTFFNFHKIVEGHRSVGNRYTELANHALNLRASALTAGMTPDNLLAQHNGLLDEYLQINRDAEAFHTSQSDFQHAMLKEKKAHKETRPTGERPKDQATIINNNDKT